MNNVSLIGRWVENMDLRYTQSGTAVAQNRLAVNRVFKKDGQPEADFINVVLWNKQAENAAEYTKKGSLVGIVGRIQTRNYKNKEGNTIYVAEVVVENIQFLQRKNNEEQSQNNNVPFAENVLDIDDSDLPF